MAAKHKRPGGQVDAVLAAIARSPAETRASTPISKLYPRGSRCSVVRFAPWSMRRIRMWWRPWSVHASRIQADHRQQQSWRLAKAESRRPIGRQRSSRPERAFVQRLRASISPQRPRAAAPDDAGARM